MVQLPWKTGQWILRKLKIDLARHPAIPKELKSAGAGAEGRGLFHGCTVCFER
jgi:hypothetical protein